MATYWIITVEWMGQERSPMNPLFSTPFQAETFRDQMRSAAGYRYGVRAATWREREQRMFEQHGAEPPVYAHPVWEDEVWWRNVVAYFKDMFVHVSVNDPSAIAFTEDAVKGEADRQTYMRPGKFMQKFLSAGTSGLIEHGPLKGWSPVVTKMQVAFYAQWHQDGKRPPSEDILAFAETEDEMIRVYEDGPDSCMMGKGWPKESHPVRVYAGGGLALAYMTSASGEVIARALCWPENKVFGRVYPTAQNDTQRDHYQELLSRLKGLGWRSITEDNSVFEGARLQKLTNRYGNYLMPYLDNDYGVSDEWIDGKSWWVMTHDEDHQDGTDGVMGDNEPDWHCENCEEGFSDNYDSCSVYARWYGSRRGYPTGEMTWCSDCRDNSAFYCDGSEEHYSDDCTVVRTADGCTYEQRWFQANDGWTCALSGESYLRDDDDPVVLADGTLIHADQVEENTFVCFYTGGRWINVCESLAVPGYHVAFDGMRPHPVEYELIGPTLPEDPHDVEAWAKAHADPAPHGEDPAQFIADVTIDLAHPSEIIPIKVLGDFAVALSL